MRGTIQTELFRRDWSIRELGRRSGLMPHKLSVYLRGRCDITTKSLQRIMDVLELEIRPKPASEES